MNNIINRQPVKFPVITLTITTCKRYDLFQRTIDSFLECCTDCHLIDRWLCIDDNSSDEDRKKMKKRYPFFDFYFKNESEKGHPKSMNMIRELVDTPFIFHMEDDWEFISKQPYISLCLDVLSQSPNIGQCLINKNYIETISQNIIGGIKKKTTGGTDYLIHEYCASENDYETFFKTHGKGLHCAYWKHFSFRPSLLKKTVLDKIGLFNDIAPHFESEYSNRYFNHGFISAFLNGVYSIHIGRLTTERNDETKVNAYKLNNEDQFTKTTTGAVCLDDVNHNKISSNIETYVINLERRPDRFRSFKINSSELFLNYKRFLGVDGKQILSISNVFKNKECGLVGCTLSHLKLFEQLANSDKDAYLIFEDDVTFDPNFNERFNTILAELRDKEWGFCLLGHSTKKAEINDHNQCLIRRNIKESVEHSFGGLFGYLVSKTGAQIIIKHISQNGLEYAIDTIVQSLADSINVYYAIPRIVFSPLYNGHDSDIQYDRTAIPVKDETKKDDELICINSLYTEKEKVHNISIGETEYVAEALNDYKSPFGVVQGLTPLVILEFVKRLFSTNDITRVVYDFCFDFYYGLVFPERCSKMELYLLYLKRFQNFKTMISTGQKVNLFYISKWKQYSESIFKELECYLANFGNVKIRYYSMSDIYPDKFKNTFTLPEVKMYDDCIFRFEVMNLIRSLI